MNIKADYIVNFKSEKKVLKDKKTEKKIELSKILITALLLFGALFIGITVFSLVLKASSKEILEFAFKLETIKAFYITISSLIISMLIIMLIGVPTAYVLARKKTFFYKLIDLITSIPVLIPPAILGIAMLTAFGRNGILKGLISKFHISIVFTYTALIFVQVFVSLPIFIQILKEGFSDVDIEIEESARVFGAGEKELLFSIYLPICYKHIFTALIMSFLRAAGEFGATIMFAGNLSGKTQTVSTYIYTLGQSNMSGAISLAVLHILVFIIPVFLLKLKFKY